MPSRERWDAMWRELGAARTASSLYDEIVARYAEPQRHYHTARHLDECFAHFDTARALVERPAEVELALWFHDAIYAPKRQDNEAKSAEWARACALAAGVTADAADRAHALVMATRHDAVPSRPDEQVLVDIDLSILGAAAARFDEYERQVREEYAWVPGFVFRSKRKTILEQFLARPAIFSTPAFRERLEVPARANLARSITQLGGKVPPPP
jgi:predicted metal-dependent HD superfamily phosphohydrolase